MTNDPLTPLINLRVYQDAAFWLRLRICFFLWRRQAGKSHTIAAKAIYRMLETAGRSCFFISASVDVGKELAEKEAAIWHGALATLCQAQDRLGKQIGGSVIDPRSHKLLKAEDLADLLVKQALEVRVYHSRTSFSRTKIIAPNPDTARGWTGDLFCDEVCWWQDFKRIWDAVEPIISSNPDFLFWLFSTPPEDDKHFTYDLLNPGVLEFEPNAMGNFYRTEQGYPVHRVDCDDAELAGVPLFDPLSGEVVPYEIFRAHSLDRAAADRNYKLKFVQGGSAAVRLAWINNAMQLGSRCCTGIDLSKEVFAA